GQAGRNLKAPPINDVIKYYEDRAPVELPPAKFEQAATPLPVRFEPIGFAGPPGTSDPAVSNINLVHLYDDKRLDILACEIRHGLIMALKPYDPKPTLKVLYESKDHFNPAHAEVVDLDGDGIKDILVANLGSFKPTDERVGSVVWLRGAKDGTF